MTKNEFLADEDIHNIKVSVHIVTYNSQDDILICVDHVLKQSYLIDSIVIVDNASSDHTVEYIKQLLERRGEQKPRVIFIENKVNVGFAPAHNQAIQHTDTDYVLVLNPDVSLEPNYISNIIQFMSVHQQVGSATGILKLKADPSIVDTTGLVMNKAYRAFDRGAGEQSSNWSKSGFVFGVSGAAAMYSRQMIHDISIDGEFFDNDFFAYKEDVDVAWRAQVKGWKAYYVAEAVGLHERGWKKGGRESIPLFIRKASYINRYKMIYKNERFTSFIKKVPYVLPYEFASNLYFLWKERKVLQEWGSFYKKRSELKRKRAQIQAVRTRE
ncbi:glycosyltransferase family 2 protein [Paenibacillus gallinarum]|uniref:Glycosyltransferase family 2 protein n=1 Tax=Paenibacillus gallinarum TaxID=2762232 RepID=A0ABR8T025_9BACL|nr:glycosyltransferase family 2 protein [Paenibacillus gallinarum]MBD7968893.1 glycosyltransferase family 2 protein [Paenibacillus gallinarum]